MKTFFAFTLLAAATFFLPHPSHAQPPRSDVYWARNVTPGAITLDGNLNEAAWSTAQVVTIQYGVNTGDPGSGWKPEGGLLPSNPTSATLRFLRDGNQIYMAAVVADQSVGGAELFNRFDGFLMSVSNHTAGFRPTPPWEHFYSWWWPEDPNARAVGKQPSFIGVWGNNPPTAARTPTQIANWDAVTVVNGTANDDTHGNDVGYTVEMRFNAAADGYDFTDSDGDIFEFNISIYDCDWFWPLDPSRFSSNRVWWQGPWGNVHEKHQVKIFGRNDVTTSSGPPPVIGPDLRIRNAGNYPAPTIDGNLNEAVWQVAPSFDIRYGDDALRNTYPSVGPFRSGQFQATVNAGQAFVANPGDATVKWFYKGDQLYIGFDVRDEVVQDHSDFNRKDGFLVTITEKTERGADNDLRGRRLGWHVAPGGGVGLAGIEQNYLPFLRDTLNGAQIQLQLKPGTTVDTLGQDSDAGYVAEMSIDLTKLGFPAGLGDRILWIGLNLLDGDSYTPFTDSYGTRTWFFREYEGTWCPAWAYLDPSLFVTGVDDEIEGLPARAQLLGNHPNPFTRSTTVHFALARPSNVTMSVYDLQGRAVSTQALGRMAAGPQYAAFARPAGLGSGLYLYQLRLEDPSSGATETLSGRMMLVR